MFRMKALSAFLIVFLFQPIWAKPMVVVSIPPQKTFVKAVAGESVEVSVLLQPGQNPAQYSLSPQQLASISKATTYFTIGVPMEEMLLKRIQENFPGLQIVDTSIGIRKRNLEDHHAGSHSHTKDPHIWLSPGLVKIQIRHYLEALKNIVADDAIHFEENTSRFLNRLQVIDQNLRTRLKPFKGNPVFVYHPGFGYFLERYGLRQVTVELSGKQPSPKQLAALIANARENGVRTIFVQPQFKRRSAQALAKGIGGQVKTLDPLAENYLDNLMYMGETIALALR